MNTLAFIGKCSAKGCKTVFRFDVPAIEQIVTMGRLYPYQVKLLKAMVRPPSGDVFCIAHKRPIFFKQIDGKVNPEHVCDSRCLSATGPNCECSCGGANHGKHYCV